MIDQGLPPLADRQGRDFADQNDVIARIMARHDPAFELGHGVVDERHAQHALPGRHVVEEPVPGKGNGQGLLALGQNVDPVDIGAVEAFEPVRRLVDAPQDERRLEGDGREGTDRQADRIPAMGRRTRHHADPGGETAEGGAEGIGGNGHNRDSPQGLARVIA